MSIRLLTRSPLEARRTEMTNNLLHLYHETSAAIVFAGRGWYPKARMIVREWSQTYAVSTETVAAVIAAISPQCDWERNLIIADDILADRTVSIGGAILSNVGKARMLLKSDPCYSLSERMRVAFPSGPKVNTFALNLAGRDDVVCVDSHATQAALNDITSTLTLNWTRYGILAECYRIAAERVNETPAAFQAIVWLAWKAKYPRVIKRRERLRW